MSLHIVILAAGKGTRMKSSLPKVMHSIGGKPLMAHVIDQALTLNPSKLSIVVGHGAEQVQQYFSERTLHPLDPTSEQRFDALQALECHWVLQTEQLGTGHAVQQVLPYVGSEDDVLILYGDVPLIQVETLRRLLAVANKVTNKGSLALLTVQLGDPTGYGRIVREDGCIVGIVEQKDATELQQQISEVNTGIMVVPGGLLMCGLPALSNDNTQGEYYLTDMVAYAVKEGATVVSVQPEDELEVEGINDKLQLARLERGYQLSLAESLMKEGVTLADPQRLDIRGTLTCGKDVFIDANVTVIGEVTLHDGVSIGPNTVLDHCTLGKGTEVFSHSVIEHSTAGEHCLIGPYARFRPGTELSDHVKVGNFVETKKAVVGPRSKINHLSYVGDSEIGAEVNVGAGTITCNYDGANKHLTVMGDGAFIGSNSALVAPVTIGKGATIGAGTTLTKDAPEGQLTVGRGKQVTVPGWQRPLKKH